jgi:uncharacterized membrane protein YphA (DoxX/SURF4 family)
MTTLLDTWLVERKVLDRVAVLFVPRALLGLIYLYAGIHKLTDVGMMEFAHRAATSDFSRFLPTFLIVPAAAVTPVMELVVGVLLCLGLKVRPCLRFLAVLIVCIAAAWGVGGLLHPRGVTAMDIDVVNLYIAPRAVLIVILLLLQRDDDVLAFDYFLFRRQRHSAASVSSSSSFAR